MPELSHPVIQDSTVVMQVQTPAGLTLKIPADDLTKTVRERVDAGDDAGAARIMFNHTGLPCTAQRITQTTCKEK